MEFKLFGVTIVLPAENQIGEEAIDEERRTTNNEIQENKDHHDQIRVERSTTSQISEFKPFGVIMALPAKEQISKEVVDQERSTSNNNGRRDEIQENKDHDQETLLSTEINQISREAGKEEEEEPSIKRRSTNKKRKINDKNTSSSKESSSDPISLMLPEMTKKKIDEIGGRNIIKILEKKVYQSDLCKTNDRFSIPEKMILLKAEDFLKPAEINLLMTKDPKTNKLNGIPVLVLDPNLKEFYLVLKRWQMTTSITYNLTSRWYDVVKYNNFQVGDVLQLWSFRGLDDQLGFALVRV
ncbi:hypothetical protein QN277_028654 [Acacia crassicarpa]|nr:hypothetical protein QN277_028654 [Acacia crassicarpa]